MTGSINLTLDLKTTVGIPMKGVLPSRNGNFSGLIGARGAVGVFAASGFAGGFFAVPRSFATDTDVNYGDWAEVVTTDVATPSTPLKTEFRTGSDGTGVQPALMLLTLTTPSMKIPISVGMLAMGILTMVFNFFANTGTGNPTNFHAGILTTTNLGGALGGSRRCRV